jgi:hypothetical protein
MSNYISPAEQYYTNGGVAPTDSNWGEYQYVVLADIVNQFIANYVGNDKMINNVKRNQVVFEAKQAIKLLNFDALRSVKAIELIVKDNLKLILPPDYVNYVRVSIEIDGELRVLSEDRRTNTAVKYIQDSAGNVTFDVNGDIVTGISDLDKHRLGQYTGPGPYNGYMGWCIDGNWYFSYAIGGRYGMDTSEANAGPMFRVNNGVIDFSSAMADKLVVLEYISDGMQNGDDTLVSVHQFAEEFVYRYIKWKLLSNKVGINLYDKKMARDEKQAEFRNAKLRLSNLHPSRLLMSLRGQNKWIK